MRRLMTNQKTGVSSIGRSRRIMLAILAFIGSTVIGYIAILVGFLTFWEMSEQPDHNGGVALAVAFFVAPIAGLIIGIAGAIWTARKLLRKA